MGPRRRSGPEPQGRQVPRPGLRAPEIPEPPQWEAVRGQPFSLQRVLAGVQRARPQVLQDLRGVLDEAPGEKCHSENCFAEISTSGIRNVQLPRDGRDEHLISCAGVRSSVARRLRFNHGHEFVSLAVAL